MSEEENIEERPEEGKTESPEDVNETISPPETVEPTETINPTSEIQKSEIADMEVHHHPHVEKKNFKEYFLEFLMIFLAVTMGFIAENIREYVDDRGREKEYVASLDEDLKQDTLNLSVNSRSMQKLITKLDSMILLLNKPSIDSNQMNDLYFYARWATRKSSFEQTDRTIVQLNNSGNFSLIRDENLVDSILDYEKEVSHYKINSSNDVTERSFLYPFISRIFDANVFQTMVDSANVIHKPTDAYALKPVDKEYINEFIYYVHQLKSSFIIEQTVQQKLSKKAAAMITIIQNDYHLENE